MILCTGNPADQTVASAVKKRFDSVDFASRTTGYDLRLNSADSEKYFKQQILKYNVFINSSYIAPGVQLRLLETVYLEWMRKNVFGHVINLGSTIEWKNEPEHAEYIENKKKLRTRSLELSSQAGITGVKSTHVIVSGLNDGRPGHENWLDLERVADVIHWILHTKSNITLIQVEP
jgi:NADP-dependent 3-hydroxy acid dehydrogenase YdfG